MSRVREIGPILRERYGQPARKVCLSLGATCPNRDGSLDTRGCIFCLEPDNATERQNDTLAQLGRGLQRLKPGTAAIAYLQDHSATYLPAPRLHRLLAAIAAVPQVVAIHIGTRPDCLPDEILEVLAAIAGQVDLMVELGLQTASDATLRLVGRRHGVQAFRGAMEQLRARGLKSCAHVILGLPTPGATALAPLKREGQREAVATARLLSACRVDAVKVHNCHVLQGTELARLYTQGRYCPPELDEYLELLIAFLEHLSPAVEVHRLLAEARRPPLLAPGFTAEKTRCLQQIRRALEQRETFQGRLHVDSSAGVSSAQALPTAGGESQGRSVARGDQAARPVARRPLP